MKSEKCYMCNQEATSKEHVPPRCIFPAKKDVEGDYRRNLIKVPSCNEHNLEKSQDDEFFMALISGYVKNNHLGYLQSKTKINRAVTYNKDLIGNALKDAKEVDIKTNAGVVFPMLVGRPDFPRLTKCVEHIAYGLYFHEFQKTFAGNVTVVYEFARYKDAAFDKLRDEFKDAYDLESHTYPFKGENPKIFYYQITAPDEFGILALRMTFFEGTHILVCMKNEVSKVL